ncbi:MAG: T9SS type A sorting domain-containing protein [Saprospiraceae bacterium]|nr:T9SS type A sorting domain-containing protein [Saprospiraceae bacterium]
MGKNNMITWTTASEVNNDVQIVERSKDGISGWEMVGKVNGTNGSGDVTYEVYDNKPFNISFYRIHSVDFDGQEQMSKIVSVRRDGIKGGRINAIYPNPATHQLTADLQSDTDGDAVITISDITGKVMTTSKIYLKEGINNHQSDLTSLPSGMYILKVEGAGINEYKSL